MAIPIKHEDVEELKKWGMGLDKVIERCTLCKQPTRFWHERSNNPCCESCAKSHKVADLLRARAA